MTDKTKKLDLTDYSTPVTYSNCAGEVPATTASASGELLPLSTGSIDANKLEAMAKEMPDECFLKGSGVLKLIAAIRHLERAPAPSRDAAPQAATAIPYGAVSELAAFQFWASQQDEPLRPISAWQARAALAQPSSEQAVAILRCALEQIARRTADATCSIANDALRATAALAQQNAERAAGGELPPLPDAWGTMYGKHDHDQERDGYTDDQMRGYAIDYAARAAHPGEAPAGGEGAGDE
jgi:hypothetical protein